MGMETHFCGTGEDGVEVLRGWVGMDVISVAMQSSIVVLCCTVTDRLCLPAQMYSRGAFSVWTFLKQCIGRVTVAYCLLCTAVVLLVLSLNVSTVYMITLTLGHDGLKEN